ncbi:hypothetical protein PPHE_a0980 [Pseudoalteromonas phenolica O-BC30]|nr:hypothetical protein [Pseudoalteromonas phenolica O-BC30]
MSKFIWEITAQDLLEHAIYKFKVWLIGAGASAKDAKQQA